MAIQNNIIPESFAFYQNYPNPFNPTTVFKYNVPEMTKVSIIVYDMQGREVVKLVNNIQNAGYHTIKWDASSYASGLYNIRMESGKFSKTHKVVFVK